MKPFLSASIGQRITGFLFLATSLVFGLLHPGTARAATNPLDQWLVRTNLSAYFRSVGFGKGTYVAVGSPGAIWTSPDGLKWTDRSVATNTLFMSVAYGNGTFVITSGDGLIFTSNDGSTWTQRDSGTRDQLWAVTFGNGRFVAAGWGVGLSFFTTSTDGITWEVQDVSTMAPLVSVTYGDGQFVCPGYNGVALTSSNGVQWEQHPSGFSGGCHGAAFGNGKFVGTYGSAVLTSADAIHWSLFNTPAPASVGLQDIAFSGTTFVAVGEMGGVVSSVDGTNWSAHSNPLTQHHFLGVTYAQGRFTAVSTGGAIVQSASLEPAPPFILTSPADRIVKVGATYSNRVILETGQLSQTYQWRVNGLDVPGATNDTFVVRQAPLSLSGEHSVVVANSVGSVTSSVARVLIAEPVAVVVQPLSQIVPQGGNVTLSVTASGTLPIGFRWRRLGSTANLTLLNSAQSFLIITNVQTTTDYSVVVTNMVTSPGVLSAAATITVLPDTDHDGLADEWEQAYGLNSTNPLDAALDGDGDGASNLDEYLAGTDPQNRASHLSIARISISEAVTLEFPAIANKTYSVQFTDALGGGAWNKLADLPARPASRSEVILDPTLASQRFYRLVTPRQP